MQQAWSSRPGEDDDCGAGTVARHLHAGEWVVLSGPTSLVVLEPPNHDWASLINTLWDQVVASSSITDLASLLATFKIDELPSFGAFFWTAEGMRLWYAGGSRSSISPPEKLSRTGRAFKPGVRSG